MAEKLAEKLEVGMVHWLGHASFRLDSPLGVIYFDPWKLKSDKKADFIFVTHDHYDHFSLDDILKISTGKTRVITEKGCKGKLSGFKGEIIIVKAGDKRKADGISFEVVPAYNVKKERLNFHPKEKGYLGFILDIGGTKIYHTGDTDFIPEMRNIDVDIALIPVGGTYTMDWSEAVDAVNSMRVRLVIPMHWGDIVGSKQDAIKFKEAVKVETRILEIEK
jgi:L-ascorbate metabolism protein UlaG (beta-lactamase superfamily)